jgi:hypothetical protein
MDASLFTSFVAVLQLAAFAILTDLWRTGNFRHLGDAAPRQY